jgi:cytochrome bd-type quinol oxidase subunit 2
MAITFWLLVTAIAVAAIPTFTMHSALRVAVRTSGATQFRAKTTARRAWWLVAGFTFMIAVLALRAQPDMVYHFADSSWANIFPVLALAGLMGVRLWDSKETESLTYFASAGYIFGMISSTAFLALY